MDSAVMNTVAEFGCNVGFHKVKFTKCSGERPVVTSVKLVLNGPNYSCKFRDDVVETVAVKALWNHIEPQPSTAWPQRVQSKSVKITRFQHVSIIGPTWFGTRGSEAQIVSPPTNKINNSLSIYQLKSRPSGSDPGALVLEGASLLGDRFALDVRIATRSHTFGSDYSH